MASTRSTDRSDGGAGAEENLGELVSDFFNLLSLLADDCPVELLVHNQVFGAFVFLETKGKNVSTVKQKQSRVLSLRAPPHHPLDHLYQFSASQLDSLGVAFDPDQVASLRVLGDSHRHLVLLLDPID